MRRDVDALVGKHRHVGGAEHVALVVALHEHAAGARQGDRRRQDLGHELLHVLLHGLQFGDVLGRRSLACRIEMRKARNAAIQTKLFRSEQQAMRNSAVVAVQSHMRRRLAELESKKRGAKMHREDVYLGQRILKLDDEKFYNV